MQAKLQEESRAQGEQIEKAEANKQHLEEQLAQQENKLIPELRTRMQLLDAENDSLKAKVEAVQEEMSAKNVHCQEEHISVIEQMQAEIAEKDEKLAAHGKVSKFQTELKMALIKKVTLKLNEENREQSELIASQKAQMQEMQHEVRAGSSSALMRKIEDELKGYF